MHASMQVTEAAKGQTAFYRTNNCGYGTHWEAAAALSGNNDSQRLLAAGAAIV